MGGALLQIFEVDPLASRGALRPSPSADAATAPCVRPPTPRSHAGTSACAAVPPGVTAVPAGPSPDVSPSEWPTRGARPADGTLTPARRRSR